MVKILVVDDEQELREDLLWAASKVGEAVGANGRDQAIELLESEDFELVVSDLKMETETAGLDVLRAAKEKNPDTQVIMVTAYGTPEISVKTMSLGAYDYLERNAPGTNFLSMVKSKLRLALEFRNERLRHSD